MPNPFLATRYHSLVIKRDTLPPELEVTAETEEGEIMASNTRRCRFGRAVSSGEHPDGERADDFEEFFEVEMKGVGAG